MTVGEIKDILSGADDAAEFQLILHGEVHEVWGWRVEEIAESNPVHHITNGDEVLVGPPDEFKTPDISEFTSGMRKEILRGGVI